MEAARAFEKESGTPPGVGLGSITDRMEIRAAVQSGNVEEAVDKVNDLNPEVRPSLLHIGASFINESHISGVSMLF